MLPGLERIAEQSRATRPLRGVILAVLLVTIGFNLGWATGLVVTAAGLVVEGLDLVTERALRLKARRPRAWAVLRLGAGLAASLVWTSVAVHFWATGEPNLRTGAVVLLSMLLLDGLGLALASRTAAAIFATPPAAALVLLPLAVGGAAQKHAGFVTFLICLSLAYLAKTARETIRRSEALEAANTRLEQQERELRDQTQRAQQANVAKSRFLAMMSHELRTPMNGVLGMARAIGQTKLTMRQANYVDMLMRSGDGLMTILNDLLDLSKVEAGKLELEQIAFDLHELGARVHDLWSESANTKGVNLVFESDLDQPFWVVGDPTRLRQILMNLVSNALKFTPQGEVRLKMNIQGEADGVVHIGFEVKDSGIGLTPEQVARLFQAFVQADASTTRRFGGTGLGLSICQELIQLMKSRIAVDSAPGEGSRFHFTLSLPRAEALPDVADEPAGGGLDGVRVLVADDNPINLAVARAVLEAMGGDVVTVPDGQAALEALSAAAFDAVLTDVHMPVMDGVELLKAIRAGGHADIPVIALTADAMVGADGELLGNGFDAVEAKPITPASLLTTLMAVLERPVHAQAEPRRLGG